MPRHVMAVTYEPKVKGVLDGTCMQTIRKRRKKPFAIGDLILLHGWEGRPYWSRWSWRKVVIVSEVVDIQVYQTYIVKVKRSKANSYCYSQNEIDNLAKEDGIEPPTGEELIKVLSGGKKIPNKGIKMQIIRW